LNDRPSARFCKKNTADRGDANGSPMDERALERLGFGEANCSVLLRVLKGQESAWKQW